MRDTATRLKEFGTPASTWEDLPIEGRSLVTAICERIDQSDALLAEVSDLNSNVLFEAGFGLARNKHLWLAVDDTDEEALRQWDELSILSTIGRVDYAGNVDRLAERWVEKNPTNEPATLLGTLLASGKSRESDAIFAPSVPVRFQAVQTLEKYLERRTELKVLGGGDDLGLAPLDFYVKQIYQSSAAIFHLLGPHRQRARIHNARASFMAGIAHGFDLPLLMVAEEGFKSPLDYKDMLYTYSSAAKLLEHVGQWLDSVPKAAGTNKRLGRLALDIELPLESFGQYVAEYEREELNDYFIDTSEFRAIMAGRAKVFVGRKGTGKTATMSQAVIELRKDRRNLVVAIKPSAYELAGLVDVVRGLGSSSEYVLLSLWTYLIYTEIATRTITFASERPASTGTNAAFLALEAELHDLGILADDDMSVRLEKAVASLSTKNRRAGESDHEFIARELKTNHLGRLRDLVLETLRDFQRVAVLIDNLDKAWEHGADYEVMSKFILALLSAIGRVEKDFAKPPRGLDPVNVTLTVFLRTDIYDRVAEYAREPDKIGVLAVQWQDEELLVRVLEERYAAKRSKKSRNGIAPDMWQEVFAAEVRGLPTRDYFLWRALPRPRDLIYFANAALTTAINRRHHMIESSDIVFAERQYSKFAIDALLVESEAEPFDLEELLFEFAGVDSTLPGHELEALLSAAESPIDVCQWLIRTSFLGIEVRPGEFIHVEGETAAKRKLKVAERNASNGGKDVRFRVHPAFRSYLEIRDDDLHHPDFRDTTLTEGTG